MRKGSPASIAIFAAATLSAAEAKAQTAPQAVGLLVFGFETTINQKTIVGQTRIKSSPDTLTIDELTSSGSLDGQVIVTKKDGCRFHLSGKRFQSNHFYPIDLDVDFTSMQPDGPSLAAKTLNGTSYRFFVTNGVKVCNHGENKQYLEHLPPKGQCSDQLETPENPMRLSMDTTPYLIRKIANVENYLRTNFCKGSAF